MNIRTINCLVLLLGLGGGGVVEASDWGFEQYIHVVTSTTIQQESTGADSIQAANLVVKTSGMNGEVKQTAVMNGLGKMLQNDVNGSTQAVNSLSHR